MEAYALLWIERLISIAVILQTLELFQIRSSFRDDGIWSWPIVRREFSDFPRVLRLVFDLLLAYPNFLYLLTLRLLAAVLVIFAPESSLAPTGVAIMFFSTIAIAARWRGSFNGGSDSMTIIVLLTTSLALLFPVLTLACLWYLALQTCSSYFISGVVKIKSANWRSGSALKSFLSSTVYGPQPSLSAITDRALLCKILSWSVIALECSFPLALSSPEVCLIYIAAAMLFHFVNIYIFGLNRFLFAWAAAYPALFYCSMTAIQANN
jgi:hypothetical protein